MKPPSVKPLCSLPAPSESGQTAFFIEKKGRERGGELVECSTSVIEESTTINRLLKRKQNVDTQENTGAESFFQRKKYFSAAPGGGRGEIKSAFFEQV